MTFGRARYPKWIVAVDPGLTAIVSLPPRAGLLEGAGGGRRPPAPLSAADARWR